MQNVPALLMNNFTIIKLTNFLCNKYKVGTLHFLLCTKLTGIFYKLNDFFY